MKKTALAIILVAILVGGTLGGIAAAGDKPQPSPKPTNELLMEKIDALAQQAANIEGNVSAIGTEVENIEAKLDTIGPDVQAIDSDVYEIKNYILDPSWGLRVTSIKLRNLGMQMDETITKLDEIINAKQVRMEAFEGRGDVSNNTSIIVSKEFPQIRHISLTITFVGMDVESRLESLQVNTKVNGEGCALDNINTINGRDPYRGAGTALTYEFDSRTFSIKATDIGERPMIVFYSATTAYYE